jgi:uncharacterized protein YlaI
VINSFQCDFCEEILGYWNDSKNSVDRNPIIFLCNDCKDTIIEESEL